MMACTNRSASDLSKIIYLEKWLTLAYDVQGGGGGGDRGWNKQLVIKLEKG